MNPFSKEAYDVIYAASKEYSKHYKDIKYYPIYKYVTDHIKKNERVLDLGCGPGHLAHMLSDKGIKKYLGIDFSGVAIAKAKERVPMFYFKEADIFNFNYIDYKDFTIVATEVLEHLENDKDLIKMFTKSKIIFSVPNFVGKNHYRTYNSEAEIEKYFQGFINIHNIKPFKMYKDNIIYVVIGEVC